MRWRHPKKGIQKPDQFLGLAEESNLIFPIGDMVVKETCSTISKWVQEGYEVPPIAVNIAARQFMQKRLGDNIKRTINQWQLNPRLLEFEVTENAFIENFHATTEILNQLKSLGCHITIDDFGTGYSSMVYLMVLPVDSMKIDQVFVRGLPDNPKNLSIIKALRTLAQSLDLEVVSEGVETQEQSLLLKKLGCEVQQGFYFSPGIQAEAFKQKYLRKKAK